MTPTPIPDDLLDGPWRLTNAPTAPGVYVRPVEHFVHASLQAWSVFVVADGPPVPITVLWDRHEAETAALLLWLETEGPVA
jgi:hypothetical protein